MISVNLLRERVESASSMDCMITSVEGSHKEEHGKNVRCSVVFILEILFNCQVYLLPDNGLDQAGYRVQLVDLFNCFII